MESIAKNEIEQKRSVSHDRQFFSDAGFVFSDRSSVRITQTQSDFLYWKAEPQAANYDFFWSDFGIQFG